MLQSNEGIFAWVTPLQLGLIVAVAVAAVFAVIGGRRGGQFRDMPRWGGFWILFAVVLISLTRLHRWVAYPMLGLTMFGALRAYFYVVPVRSRDRYAILAAYLSIPFALWPAFTGNTGMFVATVPVVLFLGVPVLLSIGAPEEGLLDSAGRTLLGVVLFVYCIAHVGLFVHLPYTGLPELFGILVLAAELPQRMAGRFRTESGWVRPTIGVAVSFVLAVALGFQLGPWCGLVEEDAGRAAFLVVVAVTLGAQVSRAVTRELSLSPTSRLGHASVLGRVVPAVYAAPIYFYYLNHYA